jgi:hypothetical protein
MMPSVDEGHLSKEERKSQKKSQNPRRKSKKSATMYK